MDKVYKPIPYYDRNKNPKHTLDIDFDHKEHKVLSFEETQNAKTGTICKKSKYRTVNRYEEMKNYRVSDFSIENLMAIGAKLNPTHLTGDVDLHMSHLEHSVSRMIQIDNDKKQ